MKLAQQYEFNDEQDRAFRQARILDYLTITYLISVGILMYLVMGSSQAMKTAFVEDLLSLIPPVCFLIGTHICWRAPTKHYPYGFHRVISIMFLVAALALLLVGAYLLYDSVATLAKQEHPSIGMKTFFGHDLWLGWWMFPVLVWGAGPPIILGHFKIKNARTLNDKILFTGGKMNKADWMTSVAAMAGVLGIGIGWWWADAVAAAFISFDILKDGWCQTKDAVTGLINRAPTSVDAKYLDLPERARQRLLENDWVDKAQVRLYEHGHLIIGEGYIESHGDKSLEPEKLRAATEQVRSLDWRLQEFALTVNLRNEEKRRRGQEREGRAE